MQKRNQRNESDDTKADNGIPVLVADSPRNEQILRRSRSQISPSPNPDRSYASHGRTECVTGLAVVAIRKTLLLIPCTPAKSPATPIASNFMSIRLQRKLRQKEFMSKEAVNRDLGVQL